MTRRADFVVHAIEGKRAPLRGLMDDAAIVSASNRYARAARDLADAARASRMRVEGGGTGRAPFSAHSADAATTEGGAA